MNVWGLQSCLYCTLVKKKKKNRISQQLLLTLSSAVMWAEPDGLKKKKRKCFKCCSPLFLITSFAWWLSPHIAAQCDEPQRGGGFSPFKECLRMHWDAVRGCILADCASPDDLIIWYCVAGQGVEGQKQSTLCGSVFDSWVKNWRWGTNIPDVVSSEKGWASHSGSCQRERPAGNEFFKALYNRGNWK